MSEDFQKLIQNDREGRRKQIWKGTMLDYLEVARADPSVAKLSHKRLFEALMKPGSEEINLEENPRLKIISSKTNFSAWRKL